MAKKVFFVDDEIVIRENIRNCIDWVKEGFDYCGDAPDGEYALPLIEEHKPDILITDIKMPFMDGLKLSAIVRKRLPNTKIVLLSGHDEFEYARQALKIGVEDYCLKPLGSEDILKLLREVSGKIDKENEEKKTFDQLKENLSKREQGTRDQLIGNLCGGFIASAEAIELAEVYGVPLIARYYAVILTDIRSLKTNEATAAAEAELSKLLSQHAECLSCKKSRTEMIWVIKSDDRTRLQHLIESLPESIHSMEAGGLHSIAFGIGSIQERLQGVHDSYLEADEDKHWRKLTEQHRVALLELTNSFNLEPYVDRDAFIEFLTMGAPRQSGEYIRQFASRLSHVDWRTSMIGYYTLNDLTLDVIRKARNSFQVSASEEQIEMLKNQIAAIKTFDEVCDYLLQLAEVFWKWRADSASKYSELIAHVKTFVQNHYGKEGLTLQDAADHVNVSASHLSKIFSQETGQTFIEFLMMTRIRKAMELMQASSAKSYEIANQVGYNDPHYFSNLFKRVTGMTIREFRKHGWQQESASGEGGIRGA